MHTTYFVFNSREYMLDRFNDLKVFLGNKWRFASASEELDIIIYLHK